jgi:hypothetical protein
MTICGEVALCTNLPSRRKAMHEAEEIILVTLLSAIEEEVTSAESAL